MGVLAAKVEDNESFVHGVGIMKKLAQKSMWNFLQNFFSPLNWMLMFFEDI